MDQMVEVEPPLSPRRSRRGRPTFDEPVQRVPVEMPASLLSALDEWRKTQAGNVSRAEAIRDAVARMVGVSYSPPKKLRPKPVPVEDVRALFLEVLTNLAGPAKTQEVSGSQIPDKGKWVQAYEHSLSLSIHQIIRRLWHDKEPLPEQTRHVLDLPPKSTYARAAHILYRSLAEDQEIAPALFGRDGLAHRRATNALVAKPPVPTDAELFSEIVRAVERLSSPPTLGDAILPPDASSDKVHGAVQVEPLEERTKTAIRGLWRSKQVMPEQVARKLGLPGGSTFARGVQKLRGILMARPTQLDSDKGDE